jgi:hypothetical protein
VRDGDGHRHRSRCGTQKNLIEAVYTQDVLPVYTEDEAGPYQTVPYPGSHWHPAGKPVRYPHEYAREGTAKQLTLFHPASGEVWVKGVRSAPNAVLHPWLKAELTAILATLPEPEILPPEENRCRWTRWQEGLTIRITLPQDLPPLRMLLVWDNLTGHYTVDLVLWLFAHGIRVSLKFLHEREPGGADRSRAASGDGPWDVHPPSSVGLWVARV